MIYQKKAWMDNALVDWFKKCLPEVLRTSASTLSYTWLAPFSRNARLVRRGAEQFYQT